jgi:hypothetical protein
MRKLLAVCAAVLFFSAAAAQDNSGVLATPRPAGAPARAPAFNPYESYPWQVAVSYEYFRAEAGNTNFNLNGFNTSFTRFHGAWFGLEGDVAALWGTAPGGEKAKLVLYGGGPRLAYRHNAKFEPWVHGLFGGAHLFPQTPFGSTNAFGYVAGGGVDIKLGPRVFWRVQGDFVGTHFFNQWQNNEQVKSGLVFNF